MFFSGPFKPEIFQQNLRVGYVYIDLKLFSIWVRLHARPTSHHIKHNSNNEKNFKKDKNEDEK